MPSVSLAGSAVEGSLHLFLPLFSSILFVFGAQFAKQSAMRGTRPYTNTVLANSCLAVLWAVWGLTHGVSLPLVAWLPAAAIAGCFVAGQLCTYLAFQYGDVSLATPVFGVKIIIVALISSLRAEQGVEPQIWLAAVLAAVGIGVIQIGSGAATESHNSTGRALLTILLALLAATSLSLFDVGLQAYGREYGAEPFLTVMFVLMGILSCGLLPWADRPSHLRRIGAIRPLVLGSLLMAAQAVSISYALGRFGDATRVNIVYALRGLWSVGLAWILSRWASNPGGELSSRTMAFRLLGAVLLMVSVVVALL